MVSHSKHRTTDTVEQKNKEEKKFHGEHGIGRTIDSINRPIIIREAETNL